jgi:inorganic pyrophosphatase/exopolyphosphatase
MTWVEKDIKKFHFNGRQIRNVVSTAMGIALVDESGDEMLKKEHLVRVAEQTKSFKDDLKAEEKMFQRTQ